ncbi:MAG: DEAD/DEAH box helicase [Planctomycetes bacterium]|nr:DEAD/DEAH box helicase [Planctomycetota bacterium]
MQFENLGLCEPIQRALRAENYTQPTPIQARSIPDLLAGRDLLGCAQTGTGKTAAFALPILERFSASKVRAKPREPRALVLTPTRELALQVKDSFVTYGKFLHLTAAVVYGGVGKAPQAAALARGVDILVATPGRLLDLMNDRAVRLGALEVFVLDEADQMLDLGFERDVERILKHLPAKRQTIFFSATMPPPIAKLANALLKDPARVVVTPVASTVDTVEQVVQYVEQPDKPERLVDVLSRPEVERALIFTRTKHGANRVVKRLLQSGLRADAIHGNKSQNQRERTLEAFRAAKTPYLVATDIAARGIDVDGITHVINFDLPNVPEVYVHRIGRTARAGASGIAISFCSRGERPWLKDIERLIRRPIHIEGAPPRHVKSATAVEGAEEQPAEAAARPERREPREHGDARHSRPMHGDRRERPSHGPSRGPSSRPAPAHVHERPAARSTGEGFGLGIREDGHRSERSEAAPRAEHASRGEHAPRTEHRPHGHRPAGHAPAQGGSRSGHRGQGSQGGGGGRSRSSGRRSGGGKHFDRASR